MTDGTGGHADRAEQIDAVTVAMALGLPVIGRGNRDDLRGRGVREAPVIDRMNVTKRQTKVDGKRDQRKPRTTPDMVTKPTHCGRAEKIP